MKMIDTLLERILLKFVTVDRVAAVVARLIVKLLEYARGKSDRHWGKAKAIVSTIGRLCSLFSQVYDDDTLTEDDEKAIADAISNLTDKDSIEKILGRMR